MSTRSEVRSPTSTRTEVRSPTRTATYADTRDNFTSTVTGGAGAGATSVTINIPGFRKPMNNANNSRLQLANPSHDTGALGAATIRVANPNSDTGALALPTITPYLAIGTIGGAVVGYNFSKKHKLIGLLVGGSLGGWIGQLIQNKSPA